MKKTRILLFIVLALIATSFTVNKSDSSVITKQIQYVVKLKNPENTPDKHHNYLDDADRIRFINNIKDKLLSGKVTAYQFEKDKFTPISIIELKNRFSGDKTLPVPASIDKEYYFIDMNKLTQVRYFEEWSMDESNLVINKRVLALSLLLDTYDEQGMYRGFMPLLYVFYDTDFKVKLEQQYKQYN